jgi:hypothetical protein
MQQVIVTFPLLDYLATFDAMNGDAFELYLPPGGILREPMGFLSRNTSQDKAGTSSRTPVSLLLPVLPFPGYAWNLFGEINNRSRRCSIHPGFFVFELVFQPDGSPIRLRVRGPEGVKGIIAEKFAGRAG